MGGFNPADAPNTGHYPLGLVTTPQNAFWTQFDQGIRQSLPRFRIPYLFRSQFVGDSAVVPCSQETQSVADLCIYLIQRIQLLVLFFQLSMFKQHDETIAEVIAKDSDRMCASGIHHDGCVLFTQVLYQTSSNFSFGAPLCRLSSCCTAVRR